MKAIYLDDAATTKPKQRVLDAMIPYLKHKWYNPSSLYNEAKDIKTDIENARQIIGEYINADSNEIYFTSGGSESNCWAIQGFINHCFLNSKCPLIITSQIEHKSIIDCTINVNANVFYIDVDSKGFVDFEDLRQTLSYAKDAGYSVLVSIQFANNEIGTIQNIKELAKLTHEYDGVFHTDAVQAFGKIDIDVKELDVDMMSISGHKIGTPKGVGALYKKSYVDIQPLIYGSQMNGMRGGTENVPYIIGMAKAVQLLSLDYNYQLRMTILRDNFISMLKSIGCTVNGSIENRLCNNINITFNQNINGESMVYMLDMCGIYISTGSACNEKSIEPSHVLKAIGLSNEDVNKTIRITLPFDITMEEIEYSAKEIEKQMKVLLSEN